MSQYRNPSQGHQPTTEVPGLAELHSYQDQGKVPRKTKRHQQSADQKAASPEIQFKKSTQGAVQRDQNTSENLSEQDLVSSRQKPARSHSSMPTNDGAFAVAPALDTSECEDEELPRQFRSPERTVTSPKHAKAGAHSYTPCDCGVPVYHVTATEDTPGLVEKLVRFVFPSAKSSPSKSAFKPQLQRQDRSSHLERSQQQSQVNGIVSKQLSRDEEPDQVSKFKQEFNQVLHSKEEDFKAKERELQLYIKDVQIQNEQMAGDIERMKNELAHQVRTLQAKIREAESEKEMVQEQHSSFIRKQQEESFRQMESARWLPLEESKVIADLDRLKRDMRSWAKGTSANKMASLQSLNETDRATLLKSLEDVAMLENNEIPHGLSSPKSLALLLNALLAHNVYTSLFRNPFFFLGDIHRDGIPGADSVLREIYRWTQRSTQEDAHIWRSQTLRLLLPPLRDDTSTEECHQRRRTEELIAKVASRHASNFLEGPARHFISEEARAKCGYKLQAIYRTAALLSYMLWTRRTTMKCSTLHEMGTPAFYPDNKNLVPHSSVRYEDHEDQLEGRPISVFVHPLLEAYGTDDGKEYDRGRVWASAEVWLDSRKSPAL